MTAYTEPRHRASNEAVMADLSNRFAAGEGGFDANLRSFRCQRASAASAIPTRSSRSGQNLPARAVFRFSMMVGHGHRPAL